MVKASQAVKMYELLNRHFKSTEDATAMVAGIEEIIDEKFDSKKDRLATKLDISVLETRMEQCFKDQLMDYCTDDGLFFPDNCHTKTHINFTNIMLNPVTVYL